MTITGGLSVAHAKTMMEGFAHLGYPAYFANLLGVAKLLGACALLVPGFCANLCTHQGMGLRGIRDRHRQRLLLSSVFGDGLKSLEPLATLAALAVSYWTRPADRSLNFHAARFDAAMPPEAAP